jgi:NurA domain
MINRTEVLKQLTDTARPLLRNKQEQINRTCQIWNNLKNHPILAQNIISTPQKHKLPLWQGPLTNTFPITAFNAPYSVIGIDGSQIYPDRHQGIGCYLINIGSVTIHYKEQQSIALFSSIPSIIFENTNTLTHEYIQLSPEFVNCQRTQLELLAGIDVWKKLTNDVSTIHTKQLILLDGSLLFWQLESYNSYLKQKFITHYISLLQRYYEEKIIMASYISLPKNRDLIGIIKCILEQDRIATQPLEGLVDYEILNFFLEGCHRSTLFKSESSLAHNYPEHSIPYFFYLNTGNEIARIEIPAWIAQNQESVDSITQIVLDQTLKGNGYPIILAEAHEQAVVKTADRDFFYQELATLTHTQQSAHTISQKNLKKKFPQY